jgi:hypothetical protein
LRDHVGHQREFLREAPLKLVPLVRIVIEPSSQGMRRRDVLQPRIHLRRLFREPAGPQPVDQDAEAIGFFRRLVDAFDLNLFHRRTAEGHTRSITRRW